MSSDRIRNHETTNHEMTNHQIASPENRPIKITVYSGAH
jgi:hypothetical protein